MWTDMDGDVFTDAPICLVCFPQKQHWSYQTPGRMPALRGPLLSCPTRCLRRYSERSARDVADHQLAKQLEAVSNQFEHERGTRAKEHAELSRVLEAMRHDLDAELEKNASIWNQHLDMVKRLDVLVQEQSTAELSTQQRLTCLESETEKVRATVASMESTVATQHQAMQDDLNRRGEETLKAVRNEVKARENEQRHFAKDLETSWKSLEAKMSRMAEQTELGNASMAERARVLEQRCTDVEQQLQDTSEQRSYKDLHLSLSLCVYIYIYIHI